MNVAVLLPIASLAAVIALLAWTKAERTPGVGRWVLALIALVAVLFGFIAVLLLLAENDLV